MGRPTHHFARADRGGAGARYGRVLDPGRFGRPVQPRGSLTGTLHRVCDGGREWRSRARAARGIRLHGRDARLERERGSVRVRP